MRPEEGVDRPNRDAQWLARLNAEKERRESYPHVATRWVTVSFILIVVGVGLLLFGELELAALAGIAGLGGLAELKRRLEANKEGLLAERVRSRLDGSAEGQSMAEHDPPTPEAGGLFALHDELDRLRSDRRDRSLLVDGIGLITLSGLTALLGAYMVTRFLSADLAAVSFVGAAFFLRWGVDALRRDRFEAERWALVARRCDEVAAEIQTLEATSSSKPLPAGDLP